MQGRSAGIARHGEAAPSRRAASLLYPAARVLLAVFAAALAVAAVLAALLMLFPVVPLELVLALEILVALIAAEMIGHRNDPPSFASNARRTRILSQPCGNAKPSGADVSGL